MKINNDAKAEKEAEQNPKKEKEKNKKRTRRRKKNQRLSLQILTQGICHHTNQASLQPECVNLKRKQNKAEKKGKDKENSCCCCNGIHRNIQKDEERMKEKQQHIQIFRTEKFGAISTAAL